MAGAAKQRANKERTLHMTGNGSSSGETSSSGKESGSARSHGNHGDARCTGSRSVVSASGRRGYDGPSDPPPRDPATARPEGNHKNVDLGTAAWSVVRGYEGFTAPPHENPSALGQPARIALNTFNVDKIPDKKVYQFDVIIGNGVEKRGLVKKVWASKAVQKELGAGFIFDGNKLAWSLKKIDREVRLQVDLNQEEGRSVRPGGKENKHRIVIRQTNEVGFQSLVGYLEGRSDMNNAVVEAIIFFDHVLRETPAMKYTQIKRNFFARGQQRFTLSPGVEAFKGVYQSMRIVHAGGLNKARLSVNVDVANGTFWTESPLHIAAVAITGRRDVPDLIAGLRQGEKSRAAIEMKKMRKLHVVAKHRGGKLDYYVIDRFHFQSARDYKFEKDGKSVSVYDYFAKEFNVRLQFPELPLVKMTKGKSTMLPMEILKIEQNQRYQYKLDERQTSNMIKFAVTAPPQRWEAIEHGLKMLDWPNDPVQNHFGMKINTSRTIVDGRVLPAPTVKFGQGDAKPGTSGRWDLKAKKFLTSNPVPLKSWGVCVVSGSRGGKPDKSVVENFIEQFIKTYQSHGGKVENKKPAMALGTGDDVGGWVTSVWNAASTLR